MKFLKKPFKANLLPMVFVPFIAHANLLLQGEYRPNAAQDFGKCGQHFYHHVPPNLDLPNGVANDLYQLCFNGFATLYAGTSKTALYSAEYLTHERLLMADKLERVDSFHVETRLPTVLQVDPKFYKSMGFDRGHLAPNADMSDVDSQYDSFSLANIVPQNGEHNRKVWRHIESHTRDLTRQFGESYVVTGVLFNGKTVPVMNGVFVPSHFFKAVYLPNKNIGAVYYSPNDDSGIYHVLSLDEFYRMTGVTPFVGKQHVQVSPSFTMHLSESSQKTPPPKGIMDWFVAIILALKHGLS